MGALFFFIAFVALIPVAVIGVGALEAAGILPHMNDPEEWDEEDEDDE